MCTLQTSRTPTATDGTFLCLRTVWLWSICRARASEKPQEEPAGQKTKASREKQRRERINERFATLAELLELDSPNQDKSTVLLEAISRIHRMSQEMTQLKNRMAEAERMNAGLKEENVKLQERLWKTLDSSLENLGGYAPTTGQAPPQYALQQGQARPQQHHHQLQHGYGYQQQNMYGAPMPNIMMDFDAHTPATGYPMGRTATSDLHQARADRPSTNPGSQGVDGSEAGTSPSHDHARDAARPGSARGGALHPENDDRDSSPLLSMLGDLAKPAEGGPPDAPMSWLPPSALDTSQDHVLRPPVA